MACLFGYKWNSCKCRKCGNTRDEEHVWNGCICSICGKEVHIYSKYKCSKCGKIDPPKIGSVNEDMINQMTNLAVHMKIAKDYLAVPTRKAVIERRTRLIGNILIIIASLVLLLAGCTNNLSADSSPTAPNGGGTNDISPTIGISEEAAGYVKITAQEAKQIIDGAEPYILLDVRTEDEYSELRIDGAILIPHTDINTRAPDELPDKDATILVYCRSGVRSAAASEALAQMGYAHVYDIGGIIDWPYETVSSISELEENSDIARLLYQGHGSFRITTADGKVVYIDPYAGSGYDLPADLILVTHQHSDHNKIDLITSRNPGCQVITEKEALKDGNHQTFDLGFVLVEAVEAGNKNHDPAQCVGYILTLDGGVQVYFSGDTSTTSQMSTFAERKLDYAILCCDGVYNMDIAEASQCAAMIGSRYSIPCHMAPGKLFDREIAEQFEADGRLIVADGEEIPLVKG